jgi:hypothetical protein
VLRQKTLEKEFDKIKEQKTKERKKKRSIWVEHTLTPIEKIDQKNVEKEDITRLNNA